MLQQIFAILAARLPRSEKGQDLAEYGLLVAFIALLVVAGVSAFGGEVDAFFTNLATDLGMISGGE